MRMKSSEVVFPWNFTTPAALILPFIIFFFFMKKNWKKSRSIDEVNLPPGPKKLPIIGNLHLISEPPFRCFRDLAKQHGPIMHLKLGEVDVIVVSSPEIAKEILKDNDPIFTNRPESIAATIFWYNYINIAFSPYGEYWRQMRKICIMELLSNKNVRSFASIRKDEVSRLVESIRLSAATSAPINLTEKVTSSMSSVTCRAAFGMVCRDKESLIKLVREGLQMGAGFSIADIFPSSKIANALSWGTKLRLMRMRRKMDVILDDIIHKHEENLARMETTTTTTGDNNRRGNGELGNEDLVDVLLRIKNGGELEFPIGYDNIKAVLFDMFTAGTETSASTLDWVMTELVRNPQVMVKVQTEVREMVNGGSIEDEDIQKMHYLKVVIMETLRLHPQVSVIPRVSREPCQISGYTIPGKVKVLVNAWAIQRDPDYWADPEIFQPERFQNQPSVDYTGSDFHYLPFGSGKRVCPGMAFGWASVTLPLAHLLYNFNWKLPHGVRVQDLNMIEKTSLTAPRKDELFVVATTYQP
ncbi:hypothetical protein C2S53_007348 [Perilla frutescens var. hirtella]|uniref:Cytochrome P450 n=1 Tax=Perilla frutescens var. hirtella TaxID=608512 RepID=A0AAD4JNH2_PERFH|nr:hypothetical protein C2S53_007348 [Perilla frutescens var. hirtella]